MIITLLYSIWIIWTIFSLTVFFGLIILSYLAKQEDKKHKKFLESLGYANSKKDNTTEN